MYTALNGLNVGRLFRFLNCFHTSHLHLTVNAIDSG